MNACLQVYSTRNISGHVSVDLLILAYIFYTCQRKVGGRGTAAGFDRQVNVKLTTTS